MPPPLTFVRAVETWIPAADGSQLVSASDNFDPAGRLEALGRTKGFGRGEGLPGRAWAEGRPQLMRGVDAAFFERTRAAEMAGITCAVALPVFLGGALKAVLVLFCSHIAGRPGALELWRVDTAQGSAMALVDGAYGDDSVAFESASRETVLDRGDGLPGTAWLGGDMQFVDDLSAASRRFRRAEQAVGAGMKRGLAIPFGSASEGGYVVAILAGADLPLALGVERWEPNGAKTKMLRTASFSERHGGRSTVPRDLPIHGDAGEPEGAVGAAFVHGVPTIGRSGSDGGGPLEEMATRVGASAWVAIPVVWGGNVVRSVAVLYL